jgi:hypothetical protein
VSIGASDLTLDVPDDAELEVGAMIRGTIAGGNGGRADAYVAASYPTIEMSGPGSLEFGASVVAPSGLPRLVAAGTEIVFRVTDE